MNRRIAFSVVSIRRISGRPPAGGSTAATIESLCTSKRPTDAHQQARSR